MSSAEMEVTSPVLVLDPSACNDLLRRRRESGADRLDEVWEGTYIMSPLPNVEHQRLVMELGAIFLEVLRSTNRKGLVLPGANVTDRADNWKYNFRCPDVVVVLDGGKANDVGSALLGGPDLLVEVLSPYDRSLEKLDFYAEIGVRELLVVDCETKEQELFVLQESKLISQGRSTSEKPAVLTSNVLPLSFTLRINEEPQVSVRRTDVAQEWLV